ncbi:MAG TPA: NAD(P)H-dependent oxidoreductase, partial [Polyangiales bacterium]|nr:NAD(P)H-dependent oxidoreductase [Polyangiales bacterium]
APQDVEAILYDGLASLPHFNPDDDREPLPPSAAALRAQLARADAVLFCTPEYAGSLPGAFKNLLDWTVGEGLYEKPVAIINSAALGGAAGAHATLRVVLGYVNADVVEDACVHIPVRRDVVGADGVIADLAIQQGIAAALQALAKHVALRVRSALTR